MGIAGFSVFAKQYTGKAPILVQSRICWSITVMKRLFPCTSVSDG